MGALPEIARARAPAGYSLRDHRWRRLRARITNPGRFRSLQDQRARSSTAERFSLRTFDEFRCIFVHIPKSAGIAVCRSLFGTPSPGHKTLKTYQDIFSPEEFTSYFKFAFVRNPWDRAVSAFLFLKRGGVNEGDRLWAAQHLADYPDFEAFVRNGLRRREILSHMHFRPQCEFACLKGTQPAVDFIGRYENLLEDFAAVCRALNVEAALSEANRNTSRDKEFRKYYSDETERIVAGVHADDVAAFGYTFDGATREVAAAAARA